MGEEKQVSSEMKLPGAVRPPAGTDTRPIVDLDPTAELHRFQDPLDGDQIGSVAHIDLLLERHVENSVEGGPDLLVKPLESLFGRPVVVPVVLDRRESTNPQGLLRRLSGHYLNTAYDPAVDILPPQKPFCFPLGRHVAGSTLDTRGSSRHYGLKMPSKADVLVGYGHGPHPKA
jgi:hypothetical protein